MSGACGACGGPGGSRLRGTYGEQTLVQAITSLHYSYKPACINSRQNVTKRSLCSLSVVCGAFLFFFPVTFVITAALLHSLHLQLIKSVFHGFSKSATERENNAAASQCHLLAVMAHYWILLISSSHSFHLNVAIFWLYKTMFLAVICFWIID